VATAKVRSLVEQHPAQFPLYTRRGKWVTDGDTWTNWGDGFLGGQLWLLALHTGEAWFRARAERYSELVVARKDDGSVHDLGHLFWPTWGRWYELTGDEAKNEVLVHAGRTLAGRFNEKGRFIYSFLGEDSLFIDVMANLDIVFHAARQTGVPALAQVALDHCLTTRRWLVRGDGSTAHEGIFDHETGAFLGHRTHQGWRDDSSWARGQAWAISGFCTAYQYTAEDRFLGTAYGCADFYIERTGDNFVPPNDWEEPAPEMPFESSAAAIAAGALWRLAAVSPDPARAVRYADYAVRTVLRLCEDDFLSSDDPEWEGVLRHALYHRGRGLGVDESVMWGDYFFLDALHSIQEGIK
jgi:unsaturated chondroitin disaccharide hydrolase